MAALHQNQGRVLVWRRGPRCGGRAGVYTNTEAEEAAEVQQVMNRYNTPLLGIYSGVEVAPILEKSRGLDWTGVLVVFAEDK